nr:MAG TPA: hypothetical protein [Caudoviricetes sp.]
MARCKQCGRFGLFLRLNEYDLCASCQQLNREIAESVARAITGSNSPIIAPVKAETEYPKKPTYIKDEEGKRISKRECVCLYDLSALLEVGANAYILGSDENKEQAIKDIMEIVRALKKARTICPEIPEVEANISALKFDYTEDDFDNGRIVAIRFCPKTPTGKQPLIQYGINYRFSDAFFGSVYYSKDGMNRGSAIIQKKVRSETPLCVHIEVTGWTVNFRRHATGETDVHSIDRNDGGGVKVPMYRAKNANRR